MAPERRATGRRMKDAVTRAAMSSYTAGMKRSSTIIAAAIALLFAAPACADVQGPDDHAADVEAFARIMADVRTAAERCAGLSPDWTVVDTEKKRLRIADVDYFAFRKEAADRADGIGRMLGDKGVLATWCADAATRYGPEGSALAGALHR